WSVSDAGPIIYRTAPAKLDAARPLIWRDRSGKPLEQINVPVAYSDLGLGLSLSPDARHLAIFGRAVNGERNDLWLVELNRGAPTRFPGLSPATYPVWSPDGTRIIFGHFDRNTNMDLYLKSVNSGTEELLLRTSANKAATDWSADGRFVLYRSPDPKTG